MKAFRSIPHVEYLLKKYPEINQSFLYLNELWQVSYASTYAVWYMLGLFFILTCSTIFWTKNQFIDFYDYKERAIEIQAKLQQPTIDYSAQLSEKRLFGEPIRYDSMMASNYTIEAILYDEQADKRSVLLKENNNESKFYYEGERLPSGEIIRVIKQNSIELENQGVRQELKLREYPANFLSDKPVQSNQSIFKDAD